MAIDLAHCVIGKCGESIICPTINIPNVSVVVEINSVAGVRLRVEAGSGAVNFDVKAKLEEKERKSQMIVLAFHLLLATRPSIVRLEVEGTATLAGKDNEMNKMLEIEPEREVPYVFHRIYQNAFEAMYLLSTILKAPPPPHNLLSQQPEGTTKEDVHVESRVGEAQTKKDIDDSIAEPSAIEVEETMMERPETINGESADSQVVPKAGEEPAEKKSKELSDA